MSHIFLSYSKKNRAYVRALGDFLLGWGFDVWLDDRIDYGEEWERVIFEAIDACAIFSVVMTPQAYESQWVMRECQYADKRRKIQMPILLAGEEFPRYGPTQFVDVRGEVMPGHDFIERLSAYLPRRTTQGKEISADFVAPAQPVPVVNDIGILIKRFLMAFAARQWDAALETLNIIRSHNPLPSILEPDFYEALIRREMVAARRDTQSHPHASSSVEAELSLITDPSVLLEQRIGAGRRLAELGDPRPGVGLTPNRQLEIDWVEIPAGSFLYQKTQRIEENTFYMARYPITVEQFALFVESEGYSNPAYWDYQGARWKNTRIQPKLWQKRPWHMANHPVVGINWYEARAFCQWLSSHLGYTVRLPTEHQWEKAAVGTSPCNYPWGEQYQHGFANVNEQWQDGKAGYFVGRTTAVGIYMEGASPYGVLDMAGNVWEWCANEYEVLSSYQDGAKDRAIRGGSWYFGQNFASAVVRTGYNPFQGNDDIGLRICTVG